MPSQQHLVAIGPASLLVCALDLVPVFKRPLAVALRFVVVEVALEEVPVALQPFACHNFTFHENAYVLFIGQCECVGAFAVLLPVGPVARVEVLRGVGHHSLAVALSILPVPVVLADSRVRLPANPRFKVCFPCPFVDAVIGTVLSLNVVCVFATPDSLL